MLRTILISTLVGCSLCAGNLSIRSLRQPAQFPVNLSVAMYIKYIEGLDESEGRATFVYYVEARRYDQRALELMETVQQSCIVSSYPRVWVPQTLVFVNNVIHQYYFPGFGKEVAVCKDGLIVTSTYFRVTVSGKFDAGNFPFDSQTLVVNFGNLMSGDFFIDVNPEIMSFKEMITQGYSMSSSLEWSLTNYNCSKKHDIYPGHHIYAKFPYIECIIQLSREPLYYVLSFCIPAALVSFVSVIGIRAATSGPKGTPFQLCLTTLMAIFVLALSIIGKVPRSQRISKIHIFYFGMTGCVCAAPMLTITFLYLRKRWKTNRQLKKFVVMLDGSSQVVLVCTIGLLIGWLCL